MHYDQDTREARSVSNEVDARYAGRGPHEGGTGQYRTWPAQRLLESGEWVSVDEITEEQKGEAA